MKRPIKFSVQSKIMSQYKRIKEPWFIYLTCGHTVIGSKPDVIKKKLSCIECNKPKTKGSKNAKPIKRPEKPQGSKHLRQI